MYSYDRRVAAEPGEIESETSQTIAVLNSGLEALPKHGWWSPPHNYVVNASLMKLNGWVFTIMPFRAAKTAYRPKSDRFPEGIVIDPNWAPDDKDTEYTVKAAEIWVRYAKVQPSIPDSVKEELLSIERHFKIEIPTALKAGLIADSVKVAKRRWGVDRLRRKKILMPFDGSKPIQLGSWD